MLVVVVALGVPGPVAAQDATPLPAASPALPVDLLFVQTYGTARLDPDAEPGTLTATLSRASGQTMYVAETPERRVGTLSTVAFLERLAASLDAPPYAGILGQRADGSEILVLSRVLAGQPGPSGSVQYRLQVLTEDIDVDIDLAVDAERLTVVDEPIDLGLTYALFIGVQGCSPWAPDCPTE